MNLPFNKPYMTGKELWCISQAHASGHLACDMTHTDSISDRLVRLPLWLGLEEHLAEVIAEVVVAAC